MNISSERHPGFLRASDQRLRLVAERVVPGDLGSPNLQADIATLVRATQPAAPSGSRQRLLVGLAAPQLGILRRIILVDIAANGHGERGDLRIYINPEIVARSSSEEEWYEGCPSADRVCGVVMRSSHVEITALGVHGEPVQEEHSGYAARIFQHEIDHLEGLEFVDRIDDSANLHWVEPEQFAAYRDQELWRNWPTHCSWDRWQRIRYP